jgi:hypothetical protein
MAQGLARVFGDVPAEQRRFRSSGRYDFTPTPTPAVSATPALDAAKTTTPTPPSAAPSATPSATSAVTTPTTPTTPTTTLGKLGSEVTPPLPQPKSLSKDDLAVLGGLGVAGGATKLGASALGGLGTLLGKDTNLGGLANAGSAAVGGLGGLVNAGQNAYNIAKGGDPVLGGLGVASGVTTAVKGGIEAAKALGYATPALSAVGAAAPYAQLALGTGADIYNVLEGKMTPAAAGLNFGMNAATTGLTALASTSSAALGGVVGPVTGLITQAIMRNFAKALAPDVPHAVREAMEVGRTIQGNRQEFSNLRYAANPAEWMDAVKHLWKPGAEAMAAVNMYDKAGNHLGELNGNHPGIPQLSFADAARILKEGGKIRGDLQAGVHPGKLKDESQRLTEWLDATLRLHADALSGNTQAKGILAGLQDARSKAAAEAQAYIASPEYLERYQSGDEAPNPGLDAARKMGQQFGSRAQSALENLINKDPAVQERARQAYRQYLGYDDPKSQYYNADAATMERWARDERQRRIDEAQQYGPVSSDVLRQAIAGKRGLERALG